MHRGKSSVQRFEMFDQDIAAAFNGGAEMAASRDNGEAPTQSQDSFAEPELARHIVGQLRSAYDELLDTPVPDHLLKLLDNLSDPEAQS